MAEESTLQAGPDPEQAPLLAIMGRFFPFDESGISFAGTTLMIKETQNQSAEGEDGGTALNVWDGSLLLARYLERRPELVKCKTVLELGSGCGLVGIASSILGAKEVVMTDLRYALPLMENNVILNKSSYQTNEADGQLITCKVCDWFCPPPIYELLRGTSNPEVILVADCIWLGPLIAPLLRTLDMYTDAATKLIITYQKRGKEVHEEFWEGIQDIFDVVIVDTEQSVGLAKPDVFYLLECSKKR